MVGYSFRREGNVHPDWQTKLGLDGADDIVVRFNPACGCSDRGNGGEPTPWVEFAEDFNMQTPEMRSKMWERFKAGKATHEDD